MSNNSHHHHNHTGHTGEDRNTLLLTYMLNHNTHHCEELRACEQELRQESQSQAAEILCESVALFDKANKKLAEALTLLNREDD